MDNIKHRKLYKTIMADPPWDINQKGKRGAIRHYDLMTLEQIKAMPVNDLSDENAVCFLWVTNSTIDAGHDVLRAWGFEPKSVLTWIKFRPGLGLGMVFRNNTEHVVVGIKGKYPIAVHNQPSWFFAPTSDHSHKPEEIFAIAERCYPNPPFLELFARRRQLGWDVWGNEIDSDITIPGYPVPSDKNHRKEK